jgi:hypothetical protein
MWFVISDKRFGHGDGSSELVEVFWPYINVSGQVVVGLACLLLLTLHALFQILSAVAVVLLLDGL